MLNQKIVFITGASSGIGKACAKLFAKSGANLLLCARRIDLLNELAKELQQAYPVEIFTLALDVSQQAQVAEELKNLPQKWRDIDILINNAGLAAGFDSFQEGRLEDWNEMIETNIKGLLYMTKEMIPSMLQRNAGHIINIGSVAGHQVYPKGAVYCATKHAVKAITEGLRMDLSGTKIRVSSIDPGAVETNFSLVRFKNDAKRAASVYADFDPLTADDIADAIHYCATRPAHVNISEMIIMPTAQASATMIAREGKQKE